MDGLRASIEKSKNKAKQSNVSLSAHVEILLTYLLFTGQQTGQSTPASSSKVCFSTNRLTEADFTCSLCDLLRKGRTLVAANQLTSGRLHCHLLRVVLQSLKSRLLVIKILKTGQMRRWHF